METTKTKIAKYEITNGRELTLLFSKKDVWLLTDVFQKYIHGSKETFGPNTISSYGAPNSQRKQF